LIEEIITVKRRLRAMSFYQFLLSMVLAIYVGFSRLHHIRYVAKDPMLTRILKVLSLPVQSTYWRFLDSLHGSVAQQLLQVQQKMRERVWAAAKVGLDCITLDTDTTVHTIYSQNKMGARKGYNPKNRGKKSYQPILTFIAETREYIWGGVEEWRSAERAADCPPPEGRVGGGSAWSAATVGTSRLGILLLGCGASLRRGEGGIHSGGAQDAAFAGEAAHGRLEGLAQDRWRPAVRV
jgi:hypothetical protein